MLFRDVLESCPSHWFPMDANRSYQIFELDPESPEYQDIQQKVVGQYYSEFHGIYKIQNPLAYAKFFLKSEEYARRGTRGFEVRQLFHDTSRDRVPSIAAHNFQLFYATRCRFGVGIYFSTSPYAANRCSNKYNGQYRAMFVADVLVQNMQVLQDFEECLLPDPGYDTVVGGTNSSTFVKYFDSEYYPSYFLTYRSNKF